ncbi:uncharacterized protein DS421_4g119250 [Arachis hypogaea]|nr:uncharacterized protein DS421_4g119250 [Arachis hypogaea]
MMALRPTHIQGLIWSPSNHSPVLHIQPQLILSKRSQFPSPAGDTRLHGGVTLQRSPNIHMWLPLDTCQHEITAGGISVCSHVYTINFLLGMGKQSLEKKRGWAIHHK